MKGNIREGRRNWWEISERETERTKSLLLLGNELEGVKGEEGGRWG